MNFLIELMIRKGHLTRTDVLENPPEVVERVVERLYRQRDDPPETCEQVLRRYGRPEWKVLSRPRVSEYREDEVPLGMDPAEVLEQMILSEKTQVARK